MHRPGKQHAAGPRWAGLPRQGFSLVELLAVMAMIGTLVSLALPAVQHAREAARRTSCGNNLHQMGLALVGYESARRSFPPGDDAVSFRHHAWSSFILPYLEEANLARGIDYSIPGTPPDATRTWLMRWSPPISVPVAWNCIAANRTTAASWGRV